MMFWSQVAADIAKMKHDISAIKRALNIDIPALISMEKRIMATLQDVLAQANAQTDLETSIKSGLDALNAHVADLAAQLATAQASNDQPTIDAISAKLAESNAALAALNAAVANTPAAPSA